MKLTILTQEYPPHHYGGAGVLVGELSVFLSKLINVEVRYFGHEQREISPSLSVTGYDCNIKEDNSNKILKVLFNSIAMVDRRADIVHAFPWHTSLGAVFLKKRYNIPLVFTPTSLEKLRPWKKEATANEYAVSSYIEDLCIKNADKLVAFTTDMKNDLIACHDVPEDKISIIPAGVDTIIYKKTFCEKVLTKYGIKKDYILFVGRKSKQKGIEHLINAISLMKNNIQIVLCLGKADSDEYDRSIKDKLLKLNRDIVIIENKDTYIKEEIISLYSHAMLIIVPSIYEPFGLVNIEAMACETPVIANNTGGMKDIIKNEETGFLVNAENSQLFAHKIDTLLAAPLHLKKIGKKAREDMIERYDWRVIAQQYCSIYKNLLGKND